MWRLNLWCMVEIDKFGLMGDEVVIFPFKELNVYERKLSLIAFTELQCI
jgi:hypothetical protein